MSGSSEQFSFREIEREDLPLVSRWRRSEPVARWWGQPGDLEAEYFGSTDPERYMVALLDGRPVGLIQHYHWSDFPADAAVIGARPDEDGIDYFLGEPELLGIGLGPAMLGAFLDQEVWTGPARGVRLDVSEANRPSWRCLEKLGFGRERSGITIEGEPGPHHVYSLRFDAHD